MPTDGSIHINKWGGGLLQQSTFKTKSPPNNLYCNSLQQYAVPRNIRVFPRNCEVCRCPRPCLSESPSALAVQTPVLPHHWLRGITCHQPQIVPPRVKSDRKLKGSCLMGRAVVCFNTTCKWIFFLPFVYNSEGLIYPIFIVPHTPV